MNKRNSLEEAILSMSAKGTIIILGIQILTHVYFSVASLF